MDVDDWMKCTFGIIADVFPYFVMHGGLYLPDFLFYSFHVVSSFHADDFSTGVTLAFETCTR